MSLCVSLCASVCVCLFRCVSVSVYVCASCVCIFLCMCLCLPASFCAHVCVVFKLGSRHHCLSRGSIYHIFLLGLSVNHNVYYSQISCVRLSTRASGWDFRINTGVIPSSFTWLGGQVVRRRSRKPKIRGSTPRRAFYRLHHHLTCYNQERYHITCIQANNRHKHALVTIVVPG